MRSFLIVMCDVFLILYLTSITNVQPKSVFTVEDIYKMKNLQTRLEQEKSEKEDELRKKLLKEREEKEKLQAENKQMERSLQLSDAELEMIDQELREKEQILLAREKLLENLNKEIKAKEEERRKIEATYQEKLVVKEEAIDQNRVLAQKLKAEAQDAQRLANQMKEEVEIATKAVKTAKSVQQKALQLKEEALKGKKAAERRAAEALAARQEAESQKQKAQKKADKLAETIEDIKQDGETAYNENILPNMQVVNARFERTISDISSTYKRELKLLPIEINGRAYVIFPSAQVGFTSKSDKAPDNLVIEYLGEKVNSGYFHKENDLIAIHLDKYKGKTYSPYPVNLKLTHLMPALLALRNNGNVGLSDRIRGISDIYFIVNRDYLEEDEKKGLSFSVSGFRGTGTRAERIVRGDQLVDLNGRLIGVAGKANYITRIDNLSGWEKTDF